MPKKLAVNPMIGLKTIKNLLPVTFTTTLSLILTLFLPRSSLAETVIEKVARTGVLTVGTRIDIIPYAYVNDRQQLVGYSVDIINLIKEELGKQLDQEITIQTVVEENFEDRIPQIVNGEVDIACSTAFTWERDKSVDFSVSYGISGIRVLAKRDSEIDDSTESLLGKRIGIAPYTISESTMKFIQPQATLVPIEDVDGGFKALQTGEIDAIAGDTVVLAGIIQRDNPANYKLEPFQPYARYGIACMVPEDDSSFLDLVNYSLVKFMQGYVTEEQSSVELVERWFGQAGIVELPSELIRSFFQSIILTREQILWENDQ
ncbi:MAG: extracellular substrate binding-like orphan protein GrrP [Xenococcaceae cyanobacterium]